ncbi:MAG TPA: AAA family ATPase [Streptosporangiaceae bacterium]|jgi:predicted ATPase
MKLNKLEIRSFRAFNNDAVEFPPDGVLLIAGANNAGKSSLLSAIDAVAGNGVGTETQHYGSEAPSQITATFTLDEDERSHLLQKAHEGIWVNEFRQIQWTFQDPGTGFIPVKVSTPWAGRGESVILAQLVNANMQQVQLSNLNNILLGGGVGSRDMFEMLEPNGGWAPTDPGGFRGHNPRVSASAFTPLVDYLNAWSAGIYHFKALRPGTARDSHTMSAEEKLAPTGENLPAVLNFLYHNRRELYVELDQLLQRIVPDIGELHLPVDGGQIRITFRDRDAPSHMLNIKNLGTGVEQLLMTLVVGLMGDGPSGVLLEEPETNLHPGAQRALLTLIREWSKARPFIITTHSPVLLDTSQRTEVLLVTRKSGNSSVRSLGTKALEALDELGVRLSDVLSADRLLLVEGTSDEAVFKIWFPEYLTNPRVALIPAGGGDNARYAHRLQTWLSEADQLGDRHVLYLRDRDELPKADVEYLEQGGIVKVPLRRELENYLIDQEALANVLQARKKTSSPSAAEVGEVLRQAADSLKQTVVLKRVCKELRPIRLMDNKLQKKLAEQSAGLTELQSAVASRITGIEEVQAKIKSLWDRAEKDVSVAWEENWASLAPGEEVLTGLWKHFQLGGFSKGIDGPQIAAAMSEAPTELREILDQFFKD